MKRIRSLGLAVLAIVAVGASIGAASAMAAEFKSEIENPALKGALTASEHDLDLQAGAFTNCQNEFTSGSIVESGGGLSVTHEETSNPTEPHQLKCGLFGVSVLWHLNTCKYHLTPGQYESNLGSFAITDCGVEGMHIAFAGCSIKIENQTGLATIEYQNVGKGTEREVRATASLEGISYTQTGSNCNGAGAFTNGTYKGSWEISGTNPATGKQVGVWYEHTEPPMPRFGLGGAPQVVSVSPQPLSKGEEVRQVFVAAGASNSCSKPAFEAASETIYMQSLRLAPLSFGSCSFLGATPTFEGTCNFVLNASHSVNLSCPGGSLAYKVPGCKVTIPSQNGLGSATYTNEGVGNSRNVVANVNLSGITYTATGKLCPEPGTLSNGTYRGIVKLSGGESGQIPFQFEGEPVAISAQPTVFQVASVPAMTENLGASTQYITAAGAQLRCGKAIFRGAASESEPSTLSLVPTYGECTFLGANMSVAMNGCSFVLHASGTLDIAGAKCASLPMSFAAPGCTVKVLPQTGLGPVGYTNSGQHVEVNMNSISGLEYTSSGLLCPKTGTFKDGAYIGELSNLVAMK